MSALGANPSVAIVGSGAVGAYYGARLAQSGLAVHFLFRSDYAHVKRRGLSVRSIEGDFVIAPGELKAYDATAAMPKVDLVVVAMKSTDNGALGGLIAPLLHEETAILTLQNGLGNEEHLAELFGAERVLGGVAFTCINRIGPGAIHHQDHGHIKLGEYLIRGEPSVRARRIAALLGAARISTTAVGDVMEVRWSKLSWNIPFNGLTTVLDVPTGQLIASAECVGLITEIIEEVRATAASAGVQLPADIAAQQIELTRSMGAYLTSTQIDRRNGRPLEIEAIFARPLAIARGAGVPTPHLAFLNIALEILNITSATGTA